MAAAGCNLTQFELAGRKVGRNDGRLTLEDGTLAGADLNLTRAVSVLVHELGVPLSRALAMATSLPAEVLGLEDGRGLLCAGAPADFLFLSPDFKLEAVWQAGKKCWGAEGGRFDTPQQDQPWFPSQFPALSLVKNSA